MGKAVFLNVPTNGHVNPSLPLVSELVKRGEQVIYYLTESYRSKIEATGAEFRPYPGMAERFFENADLDGSSPPKTARYLMQESARLLPLLLEQIKPLKPDYLIYDVMCPWGNLLGQVLNLPRIASSALLFVNPASMIKTVGIGRIASMLAKGTPHIIAYQRLSREVAKTYNVTPMPFAQALINPADLVIAYTSREFQPNAQAFGSHVRYVGPAIAPRPDASGFPFEQLNGHPLIFVSLGTVINNNPEFFRACLNAFASWQVQLVMAVGSSIKPEALGALPENAIVRPFVPQLEILTRSSIFITHGGMNSVHEGLYYGVPLIVVPQQLEQLTVAARVRDLGAGVTFSSNTPSADDLQSAATRLFQDISFKNNAQKISESFKAAGGQARAASEILTFVSEWKSS